MPLDAACLTGIVQECRPAVEGARVDKIFQSARDEIVLLLGLGVVFLHNVRYKTQVVLDEHVARLKVARSEAFEILLFLGGGERARE